MSNGKGDSPRNCFSQQYRDNYDQVFRKQRKMEKDEKWMKDTNDRLSNRTITNSPYTDPYWNQCACGAATRSKRKLCPHCRTKSGIAKNAQTHPWRKPAQQ